MKKLFLVVSIVIFILGCDDGDMNEPANPLLGHGKMPLNILLRHSNFLIMK